MCSLQRIQSLAKQHATAITLNQLMRPFSGKHSLIRQGKWLQKELPIHFARSIDEFHQLPFGTTQNANIKQILDIYMETFETISSFPDIRMERDATNFCTLLHSQLEQHRNVARFLAVCCQELRIMYPNIQLDSFLDGLFTARLSTRILSENYILMHSSPREGFTGVVQHDLSPVQVIQESSDQIVRLTQSIYGVAPEVEFRGSLGCTVDYIPFHVHFMAQELIKNAVRATTERHLPLRNAALASSWWPSCQVEASPTQLPKVVIEIQEGDIHLTIKISDQGGGMSEAVQKKAWQYGWSTAGQDWDDENCDVRKELAGFGFGLRLTRLHARLLGGDVIMQTRPGHGTDMYILLNHLSDKGGQLVHPIH